jgi:Raf kinase inhibitor-like YbhB/YbcL family protein
MAIARIELTSPVLAEGRPVPRRYTGEGEDLSPPISWSDLPEEALELALICDDPDAPAPEPWVHWVIYKIPAEATVLPEGLPKTLRLKTPSGALQGKNSWSSGQTIGYRGPMPPKGHGAHRYFFRLYALRTKLAVEPGLAKEQILQAMEGHVIGEGELMGTYER